MIGLAMALILAVTPPVAESTDFTTRLRESAAAAQALQGPLDGAWKLRDAHDGLLFLLQITDPAGGVGPLAGAWRRPGTSVPGGVIDAIARRGDHLSIRFVDDGGMVWVHLRRRGAGAWDGDANENGHDLPVALRRSAPGATPR